MDYCQTKIADLFNVKRVSLKNGQRNWSYLGDEGGQSSTSFNLKNRGIAITCASKLSIDFCDGNDLIMQRSYYLENFASNDNVNIKYVYYYLLANKDRLDDLYKSLSESAFMRVFSRFMIYYPTISEQHEIVGKLDAIFNLIHICEESLHTVKKLPYAVYRSHEEITGLLWESVKIKDVVEQISIKKGESQVSAKIKHSSDSLILGNRRKLVLSKVSPEINLDLLRCILSGKQLVKLLDSSKKTRKISLYKIKQAKIRIPGKEEQKLILRVLSQANTVEDNLYDWICSLYILKQYSLHYYLYRKNFGQHIHKTLNGDVLKYSYSAPMQIDSIDRYNDLRKELYDSLKNGEVLQYFDTLTQSVKLRRR